MMGIRNIDIFYIGIVNIVINVCFVNIFVNIIDECQQ